jgi:hypothetical protein
MVQNPYIAGVAAFLFVVIYALAVWGVQTFLRRRRAAEDQKPMVLDGFLKNKFMSKYRKQ